MALVGVNVYFFFSFLLSAKNKTSDESDLDVSLADESESFFLKSYFSQIIFDDSVGDSETEKEQMWLRFKRLLNAKNLPKA